MAILQYFRERYQISDELEQFFDSITEIRAYAKGEVIFEPDAYLKNIYFVESGFTRIYYFKNRRDITHYFFGPQTFSTGIESVFYGKPSLFGFQALAPSRICRIPFNPIRKLANEDVKINQIIQSVLLDNLIDFSNRFYKTQFETAQERYQALIHENPQLFQNASLGHIASYLGVSQQTLSVIRSQK
ncbi:MAG: Crp/Fnr family transcriptional regulator [Sphingobacterium sp.]